jgi:hypothetical protein
VIGEPSEYVVAGSQAREIEAVLGAVTVKAADPDTPFEVAEIVAVPDATPVPSPFDPVALLTDATAVFEALQIAEVVRFCVDPSL